MIIMMIIRIMVMMIRRHSVPMICHSSLTVPSSSTLAPSSYSLNIITGPHHHHHLLHHHHHLLHRHLLHYHHVDRWFFKKSRLMIGGEKLKKMWPVYHIPTFHHHVIFKPGGNMSGGNLLASHHHNVTIVSQIFETSNFQSTTFRMHGDHQMAKLWNMRSPADKKILFRFVEVGPTINFATAIRCLLSRDEVKTYQTSQLLAPTGALIVTVVYY